MPSYSESFDLKCSDVASVRIHVFDYIDPKMAISSRVKKEEDFGDYGKRQLICMSPCLFFGTKNLTALQEEKWKSFLQKGQEFEGYFIRTKNGKYDYCYKIWTNRRLPFAPLNYPSPKANKIYEVIIIDKNGDYLGLAAGAHLAFCKVSEMKAIIIDLDVDNLNYPFGGGYAMLVRVMKDKPSEIPYAAYQAIPCSKESEESSRQETKMDSDDDDGSTKIEVKEEVKEEVKDEVKEEVKDEAEEETSEVNNLKAENQDY